MPNTDRRVLFMALIIFIAYLDLIMEEEVFTVSSFIGVLLRDEIYKVINFMEVTVPNMLPQAFRRYFRLKPVTVNNLINFLMPSPRLQGRQNVRSIPVWKKVYMTLAYSGTQASTHKCSQLFGVSEEAFLRATEDVMLSLIDCIDNFISWPRQCEYADISEQFDEMGRYFPCVIGCLDGCHLELEVGPRLKPFYLNHKSYYSINLMAIVTYNMSFLDIFVGWPGRSHDSRVFENAPIYHHLSTLMDMPNQMAAESYSILADKAFPLVKEVMTPYKGRPENLTPAQRKFNRHLNSKRHTVERAFSLLKRRFRRVRYLNQKSHSKAVTVVMASCILHNIAIMENENENFYFDGGRRQQNNIGLAQGNPLVNQQSQHQGTLKRYILSQIIRRK